MVGGPDLSQRHRQRKALLLGCLPDLGAIFGWIGSRDVVRPDASCWRQLGVCWDRIILMSRAVEATSAAATIILDQQCRSEVNEYASGDHGDDA
jgi:hypothetical protein